MNLIEQLGGYEKSKEVLDLVKARDHKYAQKFERPVLEKALLQYRREHGIFEFGDKVVLKRTDQFSEIYTYDAYSKKMDLHFFESENDYGHITLDRVRHATDAEIKAQRRLDDEPKWGRAVELDRLNQGITITSTPSGEAPFYQAFREAVNTGRSAIVVTWDPGRDITNE